MIRKLFQIRVLNFGLRKGFFEMLPFPAIPLKETIRKTAHGNNFTMTWQKLIIFHDPHDNLKT